MIEDYLAGIVKTVGGRKFISWLLYDCCGLRGQPFTADPYSTAFNNGVQSAGRQIENMVIENAPESFILMCKEIKQKTDKEQKEKIDFFAYDYNPLGDLENGRRTNRPNTD